MLRVMIYSADPSALGLVALTPFFDADLRSFTSEPELSTGGNQYDVRASVLRRSLVSGAVIEPANDAPSLASVAVASPANAHRWWLIQLGLADAEFHSLEQPTAAASHTNYLYLHRRDAGTLAHLLDGDGIADEVDSEFPQPAAVLVPTDAGPQAQAQRGLATVAAVSLDAHPALVGQPPLHAFVAATMQADLVDAADDRSRDLLAAAAAAGNAAAFRSMSVDRWKPAFVAGYFIGAGCANAMKARDKNVDATLRTLLAGPSELDALPGYAAARRTYLSSPLGDWSENYRRLRAMAAAVEGWSE